MRDAGKEFKTPSTPLTRMLPHNYEKVNDFVFTFCCICVRRRVPYAKSPRCYVMSFNRVRRMRYRVAHNHFKGEKEK